MDLPDNVLLCTLITLGEIALLVIFFGALIFISYHLPWVGIPCIIGILALSAYFW